MVQGSGPPSVTSGMSQSDGPFAVASRTFGRKGTANIQHGYVIHRLPRQNAALPSTALRSGLQISAGVVRR